MDSLEELVDAMTDTARVCLRFDWEDGAEISADHSQREVAAEIRDSFEEIIEKVEEIIRVLEKHIEKTRQNESDTEEAASTALSAQAGGNATDDTSDNSAAAPRRRGRYWDIDDVCMTVQDAGEKLEGYVQTVETYLTYHDYEEMLSDFQDLKGSLQEITNGLTDMMDFMPEFESSSEGEDHHDTIV
nr:hypothetical protein B0A51_11274 [Rachicladosporium sp. CCFEE 5018]